MQTIGLGILALAVLAVCGQQIRNSGNEPLATTPTGAIRFATYNVHYINLADAEGPWSRRDWERRKRPMDAAFKAINPDILATQEMESFMRGDEGRINLALEWLLAQNPDYRAAAIGAPSNFPSTQPIFYRAKRLRLVDQGWFFFSQTPDVIYSRTFNGSYPAFASWARFRDNVTGLQFRVINIHTDYASPSNRQQTIELVTERIAPWIAADENLVMLGDLNERLSSARVGMLRTAGLEFAPVRGATYHFNRGLNLFGAIDHIAHFGNFNPAGAPVVIRQKFLDEWPSDHYPVVADLALK